MSAPWLTYARSYIGQKEIPGLKHNSVIVNFFKRIKRGGIKADEVPWCAAFVGACLEEAGYVSTRFESARSYLEWGSALGRPCYGCIVVFARNGGGHVGFAVGRDLKGRLLILGGNQGDQVSVAPFDPNRVIGYRWPKGAPYEYIALPETTCDAASSTQEA